MKTNEKYIVMRYHSNYECNDHFEQICGSRIFNNYLDARIWGQALALEEFGTIKSNGFNSNWDYGNDNETIADIVALGTLDNKVTRSTYVVKTLYEFEID